MRQMALALLLACTRSGNAEEAFAGDAMPSKLLQSDQRAFMVGQIMVAPVRSPTSENGRMRIFVYLMLPDHAQLEGSNFDSVVYPEGTLASRVELWAPENAAPDAVPDQTWEALDVRGLRMAKGQVEHFVFRPGGAASHDHMLGARWLRDREGDERASTDFLGSLALGGKLRGGSTPDERHGLAQRIRSLNDCKNCHEPRRAESAGVVHRSMDGSGFVQIASVFRNEEPMESYRPRDHNHGAPFATVYCATGAPANATHCKDGSVPRVRYDLAQAYAAKDVHATQVCAARRYLSAHMTQSLAASVAQQLAECK